MKGRFGNSKKLVVLLAGLTISVLVDLQSPPARGAIDAMQLNNEHLVRWKVANDEVVYVENDQGTWFRLNLAHACTKLETSTNLSLLKQAAPPRDGAYSVAVDNEKCPVGQIEAMNASPWETYGVGRYHLY